MSVVHDEARLGFAETQATLLSEAQWLALPPGLAFEMLPAFVMPNDPAVAALLDEAAVLLAEGRHVGAAACQSQP